MILWPAEETLTPTASTNMNRLKETGICKELEDDGHTWKLQAWAWTASAPWRWILESDARRSVTVTIGTDGLWTSKWSEPDLLEHA